MTPVTNTNLLVALSSYEAMSKAEESKPEGSRSIYLIKMSHPNSNHSNFSVVKKVSGLRERIAFFFGLGHYSRSSVSLTALKSQVKVHFGENEVRHIKESIISATPRGLKRAKLIENATDGLKRIEAKTVALFMSERKTLHTAGQQSESEEVSGVHLVEALAIFGELCRTSDLDDKTYLIEMDNPASETTTFSVVIKSGATKESRASVDTLNGHIARQFRNTQVAKVQDQISDVTPLGVDREQFIKDAKYGLNQFGKRTETSMFHTFAKDTLIKAGKDAKKAAQEEPIETFVSHDFAKATLRAVRKETIEAPQEELAVKAPRRKSQVAVIHEPTNWDEIEKGQQELLQKQKAAFEAFKAQLLQKQKAAFEAFKAQLPPAETKVEATAAAFEAPKLSSNGKDLQERLAVNPFLIKAFAEYEQLSKAEEGKLFKSTYLIKIDESTADTPTFSVVKKVSGIFERLAFLFGRASYSRDEVLAVKVNSHVSNIFDNTRLISAHISQTTGQIETLEKTAFQGIDRFQKHANGSISHHYWTRVQNTTARAKLEQREHLAQARATRAPAVEEGDLAEDDGIVDSIASDTELRIATRRAAQLPLKTCAPGHQTTDAINALEAYDQATRGDRTSHEPETLSPAAKALFSKLLQDDESAYGSGSDTDSINSKSQAQFENRAFAKEINRRIEGFSGIVVGVDPLAIPAAKSALLKLIIDLSLSPITFDSTFSSLEKMSPLGLAAIKGQEVKTKRESQDTKHLTESVPVVPSGNTFTSALSMFGNVLILPGSLGALTVY